MWHLNCLYSVELGCPNFWLLVNKQSNTKWREILLTFSDAFNFLFNFNDLLAIYEPLANMYVF